MTELIVSSIFLGVALAMDAFSVSIANGLREPGMKKGRMCMIAGCYALFQFIMPLCGYLIVHTIVEYFPLFRKAAMWIGLLLLLYLGIKMIMEGAGEVKRMKEGSPLDPREDEASRPDKLSIPVLMLQGIATSLDALSSGFAIADYSIPEGFLAACIIMVITFGLCLIGLRLGKKLGSMLAGRATILGGLILIAIGIKLVL